MQRRSFLQRSMTLSAAFSAVALTTRSTALLAATQDSLANKAPARILKTLKIGMVNVPGSLPEKFTAAAAAGFDGIELDSPGFSVDEAKKAIAESGLPVDGSVCSSHWSIRHTSPDPEQRSLALEHLQQAIRDTHAVGGHTVLLVVGHGQDGKEEDLIPRSIENISKAIPLAARLGVYIAFENVWNHFLYDHNGGNEQTADKFADYVDAFDSPWVGMQFDIGNHWKYGDPAAWIRRLGRRIVKLDAKGFSRARDQFSKTMTDGDIDWASVREALAEIGYVGWAAAEVGGGGPERLAEISADMDLAFGLGKG